MKHATLTSRIDKAAEILTVKNYELDSVKTKLEKTLEAIGIDDSDIGVKILEAESTVFEDFQKAFLGGDGIQSKNSSLVVPIQEHMIPISRMKIAWEMLKGKDPFSKAATKDSAPFKIDIPKPIGQWSDFELLQQYGKNCPLEIQTELEKRASGRYAIIFLENGKVDEENSLFMIRKARYQDTPQTFIVRNETLQVYRVGEFPMDILFECPIHSDILLVDGYCAECGTKWDVSEFEKNVLLRMISDDESCDMRIYREKTFAQLKKDFPKIFLKFQELKEEGKLPSLKRKFSRTPDGDPFRATTSHRSY